MTERESATPGHEERPAPARLPAAAGPPTTAAMVLAMQRGLGNRATALALRRARGRPCARLSRTAATENLVDEKLRPVSARGALEAAEQPSLTRANPPKWNAQEQREEEYPLVEIKHKRVQLEQTLVSYLLNRALYSPGAFHAGHLLTRHLGGSFARHNLVPMTREYNAAGQYKAFETELDQYIGYKDPNPPRNETLVYPRRVYVALSVDYPDSNDDKAIFEHLVDPEALKEMKAEGALEYIAYLRRVCERVPSSVRLEAAQIWENERWSDLQINNKPEAVSPRQGPRAYFLTQRSWRPAMKMALLNGELPNPDPYDYAEPPQDPDETDRRAQWELWNEQLGLLHALRARRAGAVAFEGGTPDFVPAYPMPTKQGSDVYSAYDKTKEKRPQGEARPKLPATRMRKRREELADDIKYLHPGVKMDVLLDTHTLDELESEAALSHDVKFMQWVLNDRDQRKQRRRLRELLRTHRIDALLRLSEDPLFPQAPAPDDGTWVPAGPPASAASPAPRALGGPPTTPGTPYRPPGRAPTPPPSAGSPGSPARDTPEPVPATPVGAPGAEGAPGTPMTPARQMPPVVDPATSPLAKVLGTPKSGEADDAQEAESSSADDPMEILRRPTIAATLEELHEVEISVDSLSADQAAEYVAQAELALDADFLHTLLPGDFDYSQRLGQLREWIRRGTRAADIRAAVMKASEPATDA